MTHKIIHISDYLLVVDESDIKDGDWVYFECLPYGKEIKQVTKIINNTFDSKEGFGYGLEYCKKIIAHIPLHNAPFLEGVDVLPPLEKDDVEKLAREFATKPVNPTSPIGSGRYILEEAKKFAMEKFNADEIKSKYPKGGWISIDDILSVLEVGVECGYKFGQKSKEKYKYTEEDVMDAFTRGYIDGIERTEDITYYADKFLKSLSQPKNMPVGFECEMEEITIGGFVEGKDEAITIGKENKPKTTTNSQGQTQWVGKYIYA